MVNFQDIENLHQELSLASSNYQRSFVFIKNTHHRIADFVLKYNEKLIEILISAKTGATHNALKQVPRDDVPVCLYRCYQVLLYVVYEYLDKEKSQKYFLALKKLFNQTLNLVERIFLQNDYDMAIQQVKDELYQLFLTDTGKVEVKEEIWMSFVFSKFVELQARNGSALVTEPEIASSGYSDPENNPLLQGKINLSQSAVPQPKKI